MEGKNNAPFRIGQKVVCIKQHPSGYPVKNEIYEVVGLFQYSCCKRWCVDYGETMPSFNLGLPLVATCIKCKIENPAFPTKNYILPAEYFAPYNSYEKSAIKELASEAMKQNIETDVPVKEVAVN